MDSRHYELQIGRLKGQWPGAYGPDRTARIYAMFVNVDNALFTTIVDLALDRQRAAPLADDLSRFEHEARGRVAQERAAQGMRAANPGGILDEAARVNRRADPEFVKGCLGHLRSYLAGKTTFEKFDHGCNEIMSVARVLERPVRAAPLAPQDRAAGRDT